MSFKSLNTNNNYSSITIRITNNHILITYYYIEPYFRLIDYIIESYDFSQSRN